MYYVSGIVQSLRNTTMPALIELTVHLEREGKNKCIEWECYKNLVVTPKLFFLFKSRIVIYLISDKNSLLFR